MLLGYFVEAHPIMAYRTNNTNEYIRVINIMDFQYKGTSTVTIADACISISSSGKHLCP